MLGVPEPQVECGTSKICHAHNTGSMVLRDVASASSNVTPWPGETSHSFRIFCSLRVVTYLGITTLYHNSGVVLLCGSHVIQC